MGSGKTAQSTSTVSIPPEVLARYNSVNATAEQAAQNPYQSYNGEFVAPVNNTEQGAIQNLNSAQYYAQPFLQNATNSINQGLGAGAAATLASLGTIGNAAQQGQAGYNASLGTAAQAAQQGQAGYNSSLDTAQQGLQAGQGLYNSSLNTIGSAAGAANNQLGDIYGNINQATDVGTNYANQAQQGILNSTTAAQPYMQGDTSLTNQALGVGQQYAGLASAFLPGATQAVDPQQFSQSAVNQYLSPYLNDVVKSQVGLMNQQNAQQQTALKGNAIASGAFGGDRAGIAQANLMQQQNLANQSTLSNILQSGYNTALGTFQQQQGVNLSADQANRAAQQYGSTQAAALGQQQYAQALGAGENLGNIGQAFYGQNLGQGQALAALGQQQYAQGLGAAQAQAGIVGQQFGMGAQQAGLEQSAAQGIYNQYAQNAGLQQSAAQGTFNQQAQLAGLQQSAAQGIFGQQAQESAAQAQAGQNLFNMGQTAGTNTANIGLQGQQALTSGAQASLAGGQLQQQTQQAQDQALYNQFLQQQGYPFQVAQFLANIAEGTGSLSGSTTTSTGPAPFFSDRRLKEDIKRIGETDDGMPIYKFKYKGDKNEQTHIGFMADEVADKKPDAVGEYGGYKTVDYDRATRAYGGGVMGFANGGSAEPEGPYGIKGIGAGGYVPSGGIPVHTLMIAKAPSNNQGSAVQELQQAAGAGKAIQELYGMGKAGLVGSAATKTDDATKGLLGSGGSWGVDNGYLGGLGGGATPEPDFNGIYASGGAVEEVEPYSDDPDAQGYMAGIMKGMKDPPALMTAQNPSGSKGGSGLSDVLGAASAAKSIYGIGSGVASGISSLLPFLALKRGGVVPHRGRYADGGDVGSDDSSDTPIPDDFQALYAPQDDLAIRTIAAESGRKDPNESLGIANVIRNRLNSGKWGDNVESVVKAKGQFEPWGNPNLKNYPEKYTEDNPAYAEAAKAWERAKAGDNPVGEAQNFYAPVAQKALGREAPSWDTGNGTDIGATRFVMPAAYRSGVASGAPSNDNAAVYDTGNRKIAVNESPSSSSSSDSDSSDHGGGLGSGLGSFLTSEKFLVPLLSGLGAMASSPSRYFGGALLSGLGGGAQAYMGLQKQQSEIAKNSLGLASSRFTPIGGNMFYDRVMGDTVPGDVYRQRLAQLPGIGPYMGGATSRSTSAGKEPRTNASISDSTTIPAAPTGKVESASLPPPGQKTVIDRVTGESRSVNDDGKAANVAPSVDPNVAAADKIYNQIDQRPDVAALKTQAAQELTQAQEFTRLANDPANIASGKAATYLSMASNLRTQSQTTFTQYQKQREQLAAPAIEGLKATAGAAGKQAGEVQTVYDIDGNQHFVPGDEYQKIAKSGSGTFNGMPVYAGESPYVKPAVENWKSFNDNATAFESDYQQQRTKISELNHIYQNFQSGRGTEALAELSSYLQTLGMPTTEAQKKVSAGFDAAYKSAVDQSFQQLKESGAAKAPATGLREALLTSARPEADPNALFKIQSDKLAALDYSHDMYKSFLDGKDRNVGRVVSDFSSSHKYSDYLDRARNETGKFKGATDAGMDVVAGKPASPSADDIRAELARRRAAKSNGAP